MDARRAGVTAKRRRDRTAGDAALASIEAGKTALSERGTLVARVTTRVPL